MKIIFVEKSKKYFPIIIVMLLFGGSVQNVFAQTSQSTLYVPLIGITSVPSPLALPKGPGEVTYNYAVKNFLTEVPLTDVHVVDNACSPVIFVTGDDNGNGELDSTETWRYTCTTNISTTTQSVATATGMANDNTATPNAYATVIVGSSTPPPLVSIVNITKVAYPTSLPPGGGTITFTYRVNNPGVVPLSNVTVTDDKCSAMSGELGDRNGNGLLDPDEVWVYTCTTNLTQTTTNTATVTGYANGLKAVDYFTLTVTVANPSLPDTGSVSSSTNMNVVVWGILLLILVLLIAFLFLKWKRNKKLILEHNETK